MKAILEKYAFRSAGKWKIRDSTIKASTEHTEIIRLLIEIGKKEGSRIYVGKREQPERCSPTEMLKDRCDLVGLAGLGCPYNAQQIERIEMIDAIWLEQTGVGIKCIFEVENSTDFMSAIQRASNLEKHVCKFMVVPDSRETELREIRDPLFLASFSANNWRYLTYKSLRRLAGFSKPSVEEITKIAKKLDV